MSLDAVLAASRLVQDWMLMLCFGSSAFLSWLLPQGLRAPIGARFLALLRMALVLACLMMFVSLPLQTAQIVGNWGAGWDVPMLSQVLLHTDIGRVWMLRMLLALLTLLLLPWRVLQGSGLLAIASGLLLASLVLAGHAAMDEGVRAALHMLNHALHLLCAAFWLGALWPFMLCLRLLDDPATRTDAVCALRRFSVAGHIAVAGVLLSGAINTRLILGQWLPHLASLYQILLACKLLLVLAMLMLALFNRYVLVPAMQHGRLQATAAMRRGCVMEIVLGAAVLGLVAVFGLLDPL